MVISPFNFSETYRILVNPITFFFAQPSVKLQEYLNVEITNGNPDFSFHYGMVAHFARIYDWGAFIERIIKHAGQLKVRLCNVEFSDIPDVTKNYYPEKIYDQTLRYDIYKSRNFYLLEFTKP